MLVTLATRTRSCIAEASARYAESHRLRHDSASYRTPAERADLQAAFRRHTGADHGFVGNTVVRGTWTD